MKYGFVFLCFTFIAVLVLTPFISVSVFLSPSFIEFLESTVCGARLNKAGLQKISFVHLRLGKDLIAEKKRSSFFKAAAAVLLVSYAIHP
jgi:hypothetical protein